MSYQPSYTITPTLLTQVEQIAALRERSLTPTMCKVPSFAKALG
jgi:hypothetical protein